MPFSGTTYAEIDDGRNEIRALIADNTQRLKRAKAEFSAVVSSMTAASTEWAPLVTAAQTLLASAPNNDARKALNAAVQELLSNFNVIRTEAARLDQLVNT